MTSFTTFPFIDYFLTPPPLRGQFYTLSVDKNRHFLTPFPPHLVHVVIEWLLNNPLHFFSRANAVNVEAFVRNADECKKSCSNNVDCGYFKYFEAGDAKQPLFCYHLKKCAPRVIRRAECPLERNNYIDHFLFVPTQTDCRQKCQDHTECRFWYWYPIDYSPAPLYCYLYRSCEGGADEQVWNHFSSRSFSDLNVIGLDANVIFQTIGMVIGGRHPGFYFLDEAETSDLVGTNTKPHYYIVGPAR
jgi:hypothetical protein